MTTARPGRTSSPPRRAGRLLPWQRHRRLAAVGTIALRQCDRRAGGAVRARRTAEFGRLRQRPEFAGPPIPSNHDHVLRRHRPYQGSPRPRSPAVSLGQAKRSSRRYRRSRCSSSSFASTFSAARLATARTGEAGAARAGGEFGSTWVGRLGRGRTRTERACRKFGVGQSGQNGGRAVLSAARLALHRARPYGLWGLRGRLWGAHVSHALCSLLAAE